jgi:Flp pilus assembly protein TadD
LKEYERALLTFNLAETLDQNDEGLYFNRGVLFYLLNRLEEALLDFNKAAMFSP